jgi:signal transduction histidine kinase
MKRGNTSGFGGVFEKDLETYGTHIKKTIKRVFALHDETTLWFQQSGVDLVTWHYKTRHLTYGVAEDNEWLADQIAFNTHFTSAVLKRKLLPYETESPYIEIFAKEQVEDAKSMGSPITILLPRDGDGVPEEWGREAMVIPPRVTAILIDFPEPSSDSLRELDIERVNRVDPKFLGKLKSWMGRVGGGRLEGVTALNHLLSSLKVTLKLLRDKEYECTLPRSSFLCPAYVGGEKVGGMAFACRGFVPWETALIGEEVSTTLLTYLRLREDAFSHGLVEEMDALDEAKRFFIHRLVHDFRHPVDALQSTVRELKSSLTSIERQITHIDRVMNQTLFALEGRDPKTLLKAKKRPDKVHEFLADLRYYFRRQFEERSKKLEFGQIDPAWSFNIDRGMLREGMENLISNALEHGGDYVRVDVEKDGTNYLIHVRDNGLGIPTKERERIFRPYFKRPVSVKEGRPRGRGLAIARMLIEQGHHGNIYVKTNDGEYYKSDGTKWNYNSDDEWNADFVVEVPQK